MEKKFRKHFLKYLNNRERGQRDIIDGKVVCRYIVHNQHQFDSDTSYDFQK